MNDTPPNDTPPIAQFRRMGRRRWERTASESWSENGAMRKMWSWRPRTERSKEKRSNDIALALFFRASRSR